MFFSWACYDVRPVSVLYVCPSSPQMVHTMENANFVMLIDSKKDKLGITLFCEDHNPVCVCVCVCASVFLLACAKQLHAKMFCHPCCRCGGSNDVDEKPAGAGRGGDAKVLVSLNSPADTVNAIIVVIIVAFCKTTNKTLICLRRALRFFHSQPAARRTKKGEENKKWHE